jgi:hypothetical protein
MLHGNAPGREQFALAPLDDGYKGGRGETQARTQAANLRRRSLTHAVVFP